MSIELLKIESTPNWTCRKSGTLSPPLLRKCADCNLTGGQHKEKFVKLKIDTKPRKLRVRIQPLHVYNIQWNVSTQPHAKHPCPARFILTKHPFKPQTQPYNLTAPIAR